MIPYLTAKQMKEVDDRTVSLGIPIMQLMDVASYNIACVARDMTEGNTIIVLAGKGNNGGDGIVAAKYLSNWGYNTTVILSTNPINMSPALKNQVDVLKNLDIPVIIFEDDVKEPEKAVKKSSLIIEGLIGYNLQGDPQKPISDMISMANNSKKPVLAIDLPSGLDATTGNIGNPCIKAHTTITLALPKKGLKKRKEVVGKLFLADIGIPRNVYKDMKLQVGDVFRKNSIIKCPL